MLLGKWTMFQKLVFHWFSFDWYSLIPEYNLVAFALHPIPVAQYHPSRRLALRSSSWFPRSASLIIRWCRSLVTLNGSGSRNFQVRWFDFFNQGLWKTLGFEWQVHGFWKAYWLVKSNSGKRSFSSMRGLSVEVAGAWNEHLANGSSNSPGENYCHWAFLSTFVEIEQLFLRLNNHWCPKHLG